MTVNKVQYALEKQCLIGFDSLCHIDTFFGRKSNITLLFSRFMKTSVVFINIKVRLKQMQLKIMKSKVTKFDSCAVESSLVRKIGINSVYGKRQVTS